MSSVETGQMSAVETGQMSAAETGQMSAVETKQMSTMKTGLCPVPILYICLVSTCASKDRKARWRSLVSFSMQDGAKREAASWKLSAASFWWLLVILNVFVCNMLLKNACANHRTYNRKQNSQKWSQNLSKIDPGGAPETTSEPPLKQGAPKTSLLMIFAPIWNPLWDRFGLILGIGFWFLFK